MLNRYPGHYLETKYWIAAQSAKDFEDIMKSDLSNVVFSVTPQTVIDTWGEDENGHELTEDEASSLLAQMRENLIDALDEAAGKFITDWLTDNGHAVRDAQYPGKEFVHAHER